MIKTNVLIYTVGNRYEGCSHKHRTKKAAVDCLLRLHKRGAKGLSVYEIAPGKNAKRIKLEKPSI